LGVGNGGEEEDEADLVGWEDDAFLGEGVREGRKEGGWVSVNSWGLGMVAERKTKRTLWGKRMMLS